MDNRRLTAWRTGPLVLSLGVALVSVTLPNHQLSRLRSKYRWFGRPLNWLEGVWPSVDLVHVLIFGVVAVTTRLAFPRARTIGLVALFAVMAAATELLQVWIPGRTPRVSDLLADLVGILVGLALLEGARWGEVRLQSRGFLRR